MAPSRATVSPAGTVPHVLRWTTSVCTDPARTGPPVMISVVPTGPAGITVPVYPVSQVRVLYGVSTDGSQVWVAKGISTS